jgi:hypothetical protein
MFLVLVILLISLCNLHSNGISLAKINAQHCRVSCFMRSDEANRSEDSRAESAVRYAPRLISFRGNEIVTYAKNPRIYGRV